MIKFVKHFKFSEFDQKDLFCNDKLIDDGIPKSGENMSQAFLQKLDILRDVCGFPFIITSGWRSPERNNLISTTGMCGPHTTGKAADIKCSGNEAFILLNHAIKIKFTGIGINQKGVLQGRFIHLDTLTGMEGYPRPRIWSY